MDADSEHNTVTLQITTVAQQPTERGPGRCVAAVASRRRPQLALRSSGPTAPTFEGTERKPRGSIVRIDCKGSRQCTARGTGALLRDQRLGEQQVVMRLGEVFGEHPRSPLGQPRPARREPAADRPAQRFDVHPEVAPPFAYRQGSGNAKARIRARMDFRFPPQ